MKGIFSQTRQLLKESWNVLKGNKKLLLIPIVPIVLGIVFVGIGLYFFVSALRTGDLESWLVILVFSLSVLLLIFILGIFFNIVLFSCVDDLFKGREISFKRGFLIAVKNLRKVIGWSIISTAAHTTFSEASKGVATKVTVEAGRAAWQTMTTFVVPVMIFEQKTVTEAVSRSIYLFTKTWGPTVIGRFSIGLVFFVKVAVSFGVGFLLSWVYLEFLPFNSLTPVVIIWSILIAYIIIVGIITSVLGGIFNVALYHYASTGQIPASFSERTIKNAHSSES